MNIHHVLFFCFLSALCGGDNGLVSAKLNIYAGAEGGNGTISCYLRKSGSKKFFCKEECKAEDILIKTDEVRAQSGRYSTKYKQESSGRGILSVTITHLTKSDSGRYRCGLGGNLVPDSHTDFEVRVLDATVDGSSGFIRTDTEGENITFGCSDTVYGRKKFLCKNECNKKEDILIETDENRGQSGRYSIEYIQGSVFGLHVTITQATKSDTGRYKCGYGRALSPDSHNTYLILVIVASTPTTTTTTTATTTQSSAFFPEPTSDQLTALSQVSRPGHLLPLVVCVPLVLVLVAAFLLLLYKWKTRRNFALNTRGDADDIHMEESVIYENCPPVSKCEDSIYQNIQPASKYPK